MEKRKKWQLFLIIAAITLTIYNILPTVFYYTKPLSSPVSEKVALSVADSTVKRINSLEKESVDWIYSFAKLLEVKPKSAEIDTQNPQKIAVQFHSSEDATKFRNYLPRAGSLIPFNPAQLALSKQNVEENPKTVYILRRIPIHFDQNDSSKYFTFAEKFNETGAATSEYKEIVFDRTAEIALAVAGDSETGVLLNTLMISQNPALSEELTTNLASQILNYVDIFGENSPITRRYFASFTQASHSGKAIPFLQEAFNGLKDNLKKQRISLQKRKENAAKSDSFLGEEDFSQERLIERKEMTLNRALAILKKNSSAFEAGKAPINYEQALSVLDKSFNNDNAQVIKIGARNALIDKMILDWKNEKVHLQLHKDVALFRDKLESNYEKNQFEQILINEIARISRMSNEDINTMGSDIYEIELTNLTGSRSLLALNLPEIARVQAVQLSGILSEWEPKHPELQGEEFPIMTFDQYESLPLDQKSLGLVIYAPTLSEGEAPKGMRTNSIYVIAKGIDRILQKYQQDPSSEDAKLFLSDFYNLRDLLRQNNFLGYSGLSFPKSKEFQNDFIFEKDDYFQTILNASREDFTVKGSKKFATLEFTDLSQRIITQNKIDTKIHEDLLKARDDYNSAQVSLESATRYDVPIPTKNVFFDNILLSAKKYFRGDERKILHWGLDLSGGKTVTIELKDQNNQIVKTEAAIEQGMNELYNRVNKMGVSEVNIHAEGSHVILDFPGSQNMSAAELVKASSMYFHVINEKFAPNNKSIADSVNKFLQDIWNEAVVTNKKDIDSINAIAFKHLYGDTLDPNLAEPRSEAAKTLYEQGLRLASSIDQAPSSSFNDSVSKIALFRGEDYTEWQGQTHPLLVVFNNFALEGSNLVNVRSSYDPAKGNFLSFEVKGSYTNKDNQKLNPRDELHAWTSQFAKDKIMGTPNEDFTPGRGWRMSVILNGSVISSPNLDSALKDSAMITGSFTQREVNTLVADLKAGSLSFTPKILSEKNVSPELGSLDRTKGIVATVIALILVIAMMTSYYRFAGIVASVAVIFNLLIMWGVLQNLQATLSLAGIAGMILTLGMAVDANVLVFERIKEEFASSKRLASAVHAGYKKAFSAIVDSNVTTIIAALILLNFDSGPIKAFAITLIIGIVSSMFTALFLTKFFFAGWVQNPKNKTLNMMDWVKTKSFDFLKYSKYVLLGSMSIILIGFVLLTAQKSSILGMDFTGGYALNVELETKDVGNYRSAVESALLDAGATAQDFQVRELSPSNNLRIKFGVSMDAKGKPFYEMPMQTNTNGTYSYESNPRIAWAMSALQNAGLDVESRTLTDLDNNWTSMSGQMSGSMRNNAIIGLLLAFAGIFMYITFRFEYKFAASAMFCLFHDVLITLGMIGLLNFMGVPMQIDMHTIAALMTIIGYSLNDTIIIFDRIREDSRTMRKSSLRDIVNHSLNITLSRTTITSATTLIVLLALVTLGGASIFSFALIMTIGVVFGTLSSLFIASPIMLMFHRQEEAKEKKLAKV